MAQSTETKLNKRFDQNIEITGTLTVGNDSVNIPNWDTAYSWGDWSIGVNKVFIDALNVDAGTLDSIDSTGFIRNLGDYNVTNFDTLPDGWLGSNETTATNQPYANHHNTFTITNDASAGRKTQLFFADSELGGFHFRTRQGDTTGWHDWKKVWSSYDFSATQISNWDSAYGWGNHAGLYLGLTSKAADSNLLDGIDSNEFARVKKGNVTLTKDSYVRVARVEGDRLASAIRMTVHGTTGSVVMNGTFDINVNHSYDILVNSQVGHYTTIYLKIISNSNENFDIYLKYASGSGTTCSTDIEIFPLNSETITISPTATAYTEAAFEHIGTAGEIKYGKYNAGVTNPIMRLGTGEVITTTNYGGLLDPYYLRSNTSDTMSGTLTTSGLTVNGGTYLYGHSSNGIKFESDGSYTRLNADNVLRIGQRVEVWGSANGYYLDVRNSSGTPQVRLEGNGGDSYILNNLAIGASSASYRLDVDGTIRAKSFLTVKGNNNTVIAEYNAPSSTSVNLGTYINEYAFIDLASTNGNGSWIDFSYGNSGDYRGRIRHQNSTEQMKFYVNGSGSETLNINTGGINVTGQSYTNYRFNANDGTAALVMGHWDGSNVRIEASARPLLLTSYQGNIDFSLSGGATQVNISTSGLWAKGTTNINNGDLRFSGTGLNATDKKLYSPADGVLEWMTHDGAGEKAFAVSHQGTKRVYLSVSGNSYLNGGYVGIGTSNPSSKLEVVGDIRVNTYMMINATSTYPGIIGFNRNTSTGSIFNSSYGAYQLQNYSGELQLQVYNSAGSFQGVHRFKNNGEVNLFGNVGIKTEGPSRELDIAGNLRVRSGAIDFDNNTAYQVYKSGGQMYIKTNGNSKIKVSDTVFSSYTPDGLWGATAIPSWWQTNYGGGKFILGYQDNGSGLYAPAYGFETHSLDGLNNTVNKDVLILKDTSTGNHNWKVSNLGDGYYAKGLAVNTTTHSSYSKLTIQGSGYFNSDSDGQSRVLRLDAGNGNGNIVQFLRNGTNKWEVVGREGTFYVYKNDGTGSGYKWQINSSGNHTLTGVVTCTSNLVASGEGEFGINSGNDKGIRINYGSGGSDYGRIRFYQNGSNHSTIHSFSDAWQGGSTAVSGGCINITGSKGVTFGGWNAPDALILAGGAAHFDNDVIAYSTTISDAKFKDEVETIPNALDKVKALRGVSYVWNKGSRKGKKDLGVIAQEVEQVLPEIVHEHEMPLMGTGDEKHKTVDYEKMVGVLIEAVKELTNKVEELENKLNGTEHRN